MGLFEARAAVDGTDPEEFSRGRLKVGPESARRKIGGSIWDLPPGQAACPYHWEMPDEECVVVLPGRPTLRHPGGETVLAPGDIVCFRAGPEGAHLPNRGTEPVRILLLSTKAPTGIGVYPDSGKVGIFGGAEVDEEIFRRYTAVDYYDGATS